MRSRATARSVDSRHAEAETINADLLAFIKQPAARPARETVAV
jgi:hypothetical protein